MNDPMGTVRKYIDAFNQGNVDGMAALFAAPASILDGIAPHLWQGPTAARDWYRDLLKEGQHLGATGFAVTIAEP